MKERTTMSDHITITHTPEDGTLATGDTRPQAATLKMCGFKWSRNLGAWYIPQSRDRRPDVYKINKTAAALRANHAEVTLEIDERATDPATREANHAERLAARQAALTAKAERLAEQSRTAYDTTRQLADMIPLGQPILVGHHSEGRHRRDLDKIDRGMRESIDTARASQEAERKATASAKEQAHRLTGPATMRRIEKLEADRRDLERRRDRGQIDTIGGATISELLNDRAAEIAYWRAHLERLKAAGWRQWSAADFKRGDLVTYWGGTRPVVRVNKKSVSVQTAYSWTDTVPYDQIRGRIDAADVPHAAS
jgi:hypothetical protein